LYIDQENTYLYEINFEYPGTISITKMDMAIMTRPAIEIGKKLLLLSTSTTIAYPKH
jgi:hypothetical protein